MILLDLLVRILLIGSSVSIIKKLVNTPKTRIIENIKIFFFGYYE